MGRPFTIQSISKLMMYGLALETHGREHVMRRIGVAPTGDRFNAIVLDESDNRAPNPMVNAGAIAVTDLVVGDDIGERVDVVRSLYERYLGRGRSSITTCGRPSGRPATATGRSPT